LIHFYKRQFITMASKGNNIPQNIISAYKPSHLLERKDGFGKNVVMLKGTALPGFRRSLNTSFDAVAHKDETITPNSVMSLQTSRNQLIQPKREPISPVKGAVPFHDWVITPKIEVVSPKKTSTPKKVPIIKVKDLSDLLPARQDQMLNPRREMISPDIELGHLMMAGPSKVKSPKISENKATITPTQLKKRRVKKLRDPHAPKRPGSSFLLFSKVEKPRVIETLGTKQAGPVAVELAKRWADMGDDVRGLWEERWRGEMAQYEEAKKNYQPSEEYLKAAARHEQVNAAANKFDTRVQVGSYFTYLLTNWVKVALERPELSPKQIQETVWLQWSSGVANGGGGGGAAKKKKAKDPNAPKQPPNAYSLFMKKTRPEIVRANINMSNAEVMAEIGKMWRNLDVKEKDPYMREAKKKLDDYYEEKIKYMEKCNKK